MKCLYEALFEYIGENRGFYSFYFTETNRTGVIGVAWEMLQDKMQRLDYREFGFQTEEEMRYHNDFFLFGMTAMLRHWVTGDCRETPHELCEILARQYSPNTRVFLWGRE